MKNYLEARNEILNYLMPIGEETLPLLDAFMRVAARDIYAVFSVPHFNRSPYDGYALIAGDTKEANSNNSITLSVVYETKAGDKAGRRIESGEAVKILTGAPIPPGADCVVMYEKTSYTEDSVTISFPLKTGENIIHAGEDILKDSLIVKKGELIDSATLGLLASQGISDICVYAKPRVGLISTGDEVIEINEALTEGKIYNSNRYLLYSELKRMNIEAEYFAHVNDDVTKIAGKILETNKNFDIIISTGGVSVGDYDLVIDAMEKIGVRIINRGVSLKPGMACAYGILNGKLIVGLSGNPASAMTNFYAITLPCIKKISGFREYLPKMIKVYMINEFSKKAKCDRLLRGRLVIKDGKACIDTKSDQGNVVISSMIGNDCIAIVPKGSGPVKAGELLDAFLI